MNPAYFLTAYDIAVKRGFRGTEEEWLASLTAFYLARQAGFQGSQEEWLAVLNDPVPHIEIGEVITLDGGSSATASITGTKQNPVLNLGIPRGVGMADALPLVGGRMKGPIDMNGNPIRNLPNPTEDGEAARKKYVDERLKKDGSEAMEGALDMANYPVKNLPEPTEEGHAASKGYVDSKHFLKTVMLSADAWSEEAPYVQTIAVPGILETDAPHWGLIRSGTAEAARAQKEAYALVDDLDTADGSVTFTCDEERPGVDLTIQLEVNR